MENKPDITTYHPCGFIEIATTEALLILTTEEFERAALRGVSVALNRGYADKKKGDNTYERLHP